MICMTCMICVLVVPRFKQKYLRDSGGMSLTCAVRLSANQQCSPSSRMTKARKEICRGRCTGSGPTCGKCWNVSMNRTRCSHTQQSTAVMIQSPRHTETNSITPPHRNKFNHPTTHKQIQSPHHTETNQITPPHRHKFNHPATQTQIHSPRHTNHFRQICNTDANSIVCHTKTNSISLQQRTNSINPLHKSKLNHSAKQTPIQSVCCTNTNSVILQHKCQFSKTAAHTPSVHVNVLLQRKKSESW